MHCKLCILCIASSIYYYIITSYTNIYYIGTAKNPRAFAASRVNINNLNIRWKWNSKAWMTGEIFEEWLRWFDTIMIHRKVVLLMDNFSAHELAVKSINNSTSPLRNTLVIWLPANSTSRFQPLDQGIINTWKTYWKRQWVKYIVCEFDNGRNPMVSMNILKALQWGIQAWELDVSAYTIKNCYQKALSISLNILDTQSTSDIQSLVNEISSDIRIMQTWVPNPMDIENFLNPIDEIVTDDLGTIDHVVLSGFLPEVDEDEIEIEEAQVLHDEAIQALKKLCLYEEQQDQGEAHLISALHKHERLVEARKVGGRKQSDIRDFFNV